MTQEKPGLFRRLVWHGGVIIALVVTAGIPLVLVWAFVQRFVFVDAAYAEQVPMLEWLIGVTVLGATWWFKLVPHCRRCIRVWRGRNGQEADAYRKSVEDIGRGGSTTGNVIAKIMLIPFVLLGMGMIIWMVVGLFN